MDFGTFYRLRQLRVRERVRDMDVMTCDDVHGSENLYSDFDHPAHPQLNHSMGFEGDAAHIYGNSALGRDFGDDQSWEFQEERDINLGLRDSIGMDRARGRRRRMEPSGMRGGFRPGRGWPSDRDGGQASNENPWTDQVSETGPPWHDEGDYVWGEERRQPVEQRESLNKSSDQDDHAADLKRPVMSKNSQFPDDSGNERSPAEGTISSDVSKMKTNDLPGPSSDVQMPVPAKVGEKESVTDQKLFAKKAEKTDNLDGKKKSSDETGGQGSKSTPDDDVSVKSVGGKFQGKPLEKGVIADIEDMAATQLQDPNRTVFSCCYCGISDYSKDDFKDHVKGNFHKQKFASLKAGKRRKQQNASLMLFEREELGKFSFLEMDLDSFRRQPVIGLSYVTEFQSIFGIRCICHLCGVLFSHISGQNHLTNFQHCARYLKEKKIDFDEGIYLHPYKRYKMNAIHDIIQDAERHDGRGKPAIFVFEGKANSDGNADGVDAEKSRKAFVEFVNEELQTARQKISDDPFLLGEEDDESQTFTDQSDYVQLWDLEEDKERFFEDNMTFEKDFRHKLDSDSYNERRHIGDANARAGQKQRDQATLGKRGMEPPNEGNRRSLVSDYTDTSNDAAAGNTSSDSSKLRATDVSSTSSDNTASCSVIEGQKDEKETSIMETKKGDHQGGSDGNEMPKQDADDKKKNEGKEKRSQAVIQEVFSSHELGKVSFLKRECSSHSEELYIGLSFVTEYQHTTIAQCLCHLCGVSFIYRSGHTHLLGFKHRLRYLRKMKPKAYAELSKLRTKKEVLTKMIPFLKNIVKNDGIGDPAIHVYGIEEDVDTEAQKSNSAADNQTEDSSSNTKRSQAEIERLHFKFLNFFREVYLTDKAIEREPVPFENGPMQDLSPSGCLLPTPVFNVETSDVRMRPGPYFNPDPYEMARRARFYPDQRIGDKPYFDLEPMNRIRPDEPYLDPDPLKRDRRQEPYLDPDPLKRIIRREPYYDPTSSKRRAHVEPYLHPDPLKRLRFDEPYIHPDPLKRILPSQRSAKKPVVIDYGHGKDKKSAKNTADQWEQDIKDILNESKVPDSLAQLSCSYSSPRKEDTPPPSQSKRPLPFSRSYMEKSKELQNKLSSSKRGRSQDSPNRDKSKVWYKSGSPSRKYRRSRSPSSVKDRSRARLKDPLRRDKSDSLGRVYGRLKSPEIVDSSSNRYKQSRSPESFRSEGSLKEKDKTFMKKISRSPVKEKSIASIADKSISLPRKKGVVSSREQMHHNRLENIRRQKESRQPDLIIDLTSDEESSLPSKKATPLIHPSVEKSPPKKESEPVTASDVDETQANLIAEMLLTMKSSIIGQDADPQSALKAIMSQDITNVLLATKQLDEKRSSPVRVKQMKQVDGDRCSRERHSEEKAGPSERLLDLKSKVERTPPPREKITFSFAGRSRISGNLVSQSVHFSDDNDEEDENDN